MSKILLFTFCDSGAAGIRHLASFLKMYDHTVHLVMIESKHSICSTIDISYDYFKYKEYSSIFPLTPIWMGHLIYYSAPSSLMLPECFLQYIQTYNPDLIGLSTRLFPKLPFKEWFSQLRDVSSALLVAGGFGPSTAPEVFLNTKADLVVRGEGEYALLELANCLDNKTSWLNIFNLSYKKGEDLIHNPLRPVEKRLDNFPPPLLYSSGIFYTKNNDIIEQDPLHGFVTRDILTGRGCIGSCSYCCADYFRELYRKEGIIHPKYRYRNTDSVIEEMLLHKEQGAKCLRLADDFFIRPPDEMNNFLDNYAEKIGLPFVCNFSMDYLQHHPDILEKAVQAGLERLLVCVQSPDELVARNIFNRKNNLEAIKWAIQTGHKHFISVSIDIIEGYSIPNMDDLDAKINFIKNLPPFNAAYPESIMLNIPNLNIWASSTIRNFSPDIDSHMLSPKEFLYRAMLLTFRYILDDKSFTNFRNIQTYKDDPSVLPEMFCRILNKRHTDHLVMQAKRLEGREVYFWGTGPVYKSRKHLFSQVKPVAIIDNEISAVEIDGIPVVKSVDILLSRPLPVIIFAWLGGMSVIRKIKRLLPDMPEEDIVLCMMDEFPGQANMSEAIHTIKEYDRTILQLKSMIEDQQSKINTMRSSISWKITGPLRQLIRFLNTKIG